MFPGRLLIQLICRGADLSGVNLPMRTSLGPIWKGRTSPEPISAEHSSLGPIFPLCTLEGTNLRNAFLLEANLSSTDLSGADLLGARYNHKTRFPRGFIPSQVGMTQQTSISRARPL